MKVSVAFLLCALSLSPAVLGGFNDQPVPRWIKDKNTGTMVRNPNHPENRKTSQAQLQANKLNMVETFPIVSTMEQYKEFNDALQSYNEKPRPLADSLESTLDMMNDADLARQVNIASDKWVGALGAIFAKYETPIGLMNKLFELQRFDALEFVIDDSGSMGSNTDMLGPRGEKLTRWQEAQHRMKEFLEILAYVPTKTIRICFLNHGDELAFDRTQNPMSPEQFIQHTYQKLDAVFRKGPGGGTPYVRKIRESLAQGGSIARYFFSDGQPTDMYLESAIAEITRMVKTRRDPENNPVTFLSCTNEDKQVEWMKEVEEVAPYCGELDDYEDEAREVLKDQGRAFPFTKGLYLIASLVGAMNPHDLDAMDESIPFAKTTFDNIFGMQSGLTEYNNYYQLFLQAQRDAFNVAQNEARYSGERISVLDHFKYTFNWQPYYEQFATAVNRESIPAVQNYRSELNRLSGGTSGTVPHQQMPGGYGYGSSQGYQQPSHGSAGYQQPSYGSAGYQQPSHHYPSQSYQPSSHSTGSGFFRKFFG